MRAPLITQFLQYAAAGSAGTLGHYLVLLVLVNVFTIAPVGASILGFLTGAAINYCLNYHWVFRSRRRHFETMLKFLGITGVGFVLNAALMHLGVILLGFHYLLTQLATTAIVLLWNFAGNRFWTFADDTGKLTQR